MPEMILTEAAKAQKKYKCPYCDKRDTKEKLLSHIEDVHEDLIPAGYTPARVLFNSINKKDHGTCVCGCGREAYWNENLCRYERFSPDPKCKERYIKMVNERKAKKYGDWNLAKDPEFQKKMLAGRRISGTYNFKGTPFTYTGSFEKKIVGFLDKVVNYEPEHIMMPGPIIYYMYNGEEHAYISDIYIIPYNLIIEVKDGGDNPNTREMAEYRRKQAAKEDQIIKDGEYNYVRVTNNQFDQLLAVLAELKMQLVDDTYKKGEKIVRINENMEAMHINVENAPVMVHYQNNITLSEGLLMATDVLLGKVYTEGGFISGKDALRDCNYTVYSSCNEVTIPKYLDSGSIFEAFTGHTLYSYSQIPFDKSLTELTDVWGEIRQCSENVTDYMRCSENEQIKKLDAIAEQLSML